MKATRPLRRSSGKLEKLDLIATSLLEVETLDGSQVEEIVKPVAGIHLSHLKNPLQQMHPISQTLPQSDTEKDGQNWTPDLGRPPATA